MSSAAREFADQMPDGRLLDSDEPEMESSLHYQQLLLLVSILQWLWRDRQDYFIGANLTIYYSRQQLKNREFRGPDFFLVKDTDPHPRRSWVVWEEDGRLPNLILELLSPATARQDRQEKKRLYQDRFRTPEYFWFDPASLEFEGFRLVEGTYQAIAPEPQGWRWSRELGLYLGIVDRQLRYLNPDGTPVPSPQEAASAAQARADAEQARADALAERLRSLGIDPDRPIERPAEP